MRFNNHMDGTKSSDYESLKKVVLVIIWNLIKLDATDCTCTDLRVWSVCGIWDFSGVLVKSSWSISPLTSTIGGSVTT